jgi:HSP20 family protein
MARSIDRFNPLTELDALQRRFFGDDFFTSFRGSAVPTTDVYTEGDERLIVEVHLPNFDENDISISVDDGALIVQAERRERTEDGNKKYMVRESSSSFYRRITLTERADEGNITANFTTGVLKIVVPFRELPSPKRIAITSGEAKDGETDRAVEGTRTEAGGSSS